MIPKFVSRKSLRVPSVIRGAQPLYDWTCLKQTETWR